MFDDDYTPYPDGYEPPTDTDEDDDAAPVWTDADKKASEGDLIGLATMTDDEIASAIGGAS